MTRPPLSVALATLCLCLLLGACNRGRDLADAASPAAPQRAADRLQPQALHVASGRAQAPAEPPARRYMAVRHELQLQTDPDAVEAAWRRAEQACIAAGCEVLASSLSREDSRRPATAELDVRVPPDQVDTFLQQVGALGSVGQHRKTAEDMTDEVLDVEARLKNMTELRDKLRLLLATRDAKLKDVVEVERELARVQSELDSLASRRKALSQQTEKVRVGLRIVARPTVLETGVWAPVTQAVTSAGRALAESLGALISVVVAALPWALMLAGAVAAVRWLWRRRSRAA